MFEVELAATCYISLAWVLHSLKKEKKRVLLFFTLPLVSCLSMPLLGAWNSCQALSYLGLEQLHSWHDVGWNDRVCVLNIKFSSITWILHPALCVFNGTQLGMPTNGICYKYGRHICIQFSSDHGYIHEYLQVICQFENSNKYMLTLINVSEDVS